jgi:hypothetical protein
MLPTMPTGQLVLLVAAAALLVLRIVWYLAYGRGKEVGPTYAEPTLKLDNSDAPGEVFGELESTLEADHHADERYLKRRSQEDAPLAAPVPVSRKVALAVICVAAFVALPYLHGSLGWLRLLSAEPTAEAADERPSSMGGVMPAASIGQDEVPDETVDQQARAKELSEELPDDRNPLAKAKVAVPPAVKEEKPKISIDDASGESLAKFFDKLMRVENKEAGQIARILYYGDSIVGSDFVSGMLRRKLQDRFGDAGHGYAILANAWKGFFHIDVNRTAAASWTRSTCVGPYAEDGLYGLGCATFITPHKGIWAEFGTADIGEWKWGRNVSRFELEYLKQPGGGSLRVSVDGGEGETISTSAEATAVAYHAVQVADGPHKLRVESVGDGPVRVFGIRMERDVPGVTLSALGITGARARFLDKQDDAHFATVLGAAKPDLVVLAFGSNEIADGHQYPIEDYDKTLQAVMEQIERALPDASFMLVGPPDMASKDASQGHASPYVPVMVAAQKRIAAARGWAFWNQYQVMGGGGSMWSWVQSGLGNQDLVHPTGHGGAILGRWQYHALVDAYERHKEERR